MTWKPTKWVHEEFNLYLWKDQNDCDTCCIETCSIFLSRLILNLTVWMLTFGGLKLPTIGSQLHLQSNSNLDCFLLFVSYWAPNSLNWVFANSSKVTNELSFYFRNSQIIRYIALICIYHRSSRSYETLSCPQPLSSIPTSKFNCTVQSLKTFDIFTWISFFMSNSWISFSALSSDINVGSLTYSLTTTSVRHYLLCLWKCRRPHRCRI